MADEEVHLFLGMCRTFECTTLNINFAVVEYKFSETGIESCCLFRLFQCKLVMFFLPDKTLAIALIEKARQFASQC